MQYDLPPRRPDTARARWTRRDALKLSGVAVVGATAPALADNTASFAAPPPRLPDDGRRARNVILLVSDGMSPGVLSLAQPFADRVRSEHHTLHWHELSHDPAAAAGLYDCGSADSMVTDSAAAASAWSSGQRVNNGSLNVAPDGKALTPIADRVHASGRRVGLVTTTRVTHATPAAFAAVHEDRNAENDIASQMLGKADVIMGGGRRHFAPDRRGDGVDLLADAKDRGFTLWSRRDQVLAGATGERVLGLFTDTHLPFTIDHRQSGERWATVPTLAEMTHAALTSLDRVEGFLLQVEGGRIDHACHANDAAAALWDQLAFDDAVGVALEFAAGRDDTLVVVTTDHGNANPGLNGVGKKYTGSPAAFDRLARATHSFEWLSESLGARLASPGVVASEAAEHLGVELTSREAEAVARAFAGEEVFELNAQHRGPHAQLAQALGNHTGVQFTGVSHTADYAVLHALGPTAPRFAGVRSNTDLHANLLHAMAIAPAAS